MKNLFVPRPLFETLLEIALDRFEPAGLKPVVVSRVNAAIRAAGDILDNAEASVRRDQAAFAAPDGCREVE